MGAPNWTEEEKILLGKVWLEPGSLKLLAAKYFPARTSDGLKMMGVRLGLPSTRGRLKYHRRPGACAIKVRQALEQNDSLTCYEIEALLGGSVTLQTVQDYAKRWFLAGETHIAGWRRRSPDGQWSAAYKLGKGVNEDRPAAKSGNQVNRERYARSVGCKKTTNPFLVAAGLVEAPKCSNGRVYAQPMEIDDWSVAERRVA